MFDFLPGKLVPGCLIFFVAMSVQAADYSMQPIKTDPARIQDKIMLSVSWESFQDMELDEVENFDGWTVATELVVPFMDKFQFRFNLPLRTEGDAVVKSDHWLRPGIDIDVEGNGGVFDFITLVFEHQLFGEQDKGYNLSYYVGGGAVGDQLETTLLRPGEGTDSINHNGTVWMLGVKADTERWDTRLLGNLGIRGYARSDDLNPGGNDQMYLLDLKGAVIFAPWGKYVHPVLEFTYLGDFTDVNQITLLPELLIPVNPHLELKAGVAIGLGGNGSEIGGQAEASIRF